MPIKCSSVYKHAKALSQCVDGRPMRTDLSDRANSFSFVCRFPLFRAIKADKIPALNT